MKQTVFKRLTAVVAMAAVICIAKAPIHAEERAVTLPEVLAIARENNGDLKALRQEVGISESGKIQAGLYPNPVVELEGATGAFTGSSSENRLAIGLAQELLIGGKRDKRLIVAESELLRFDNLVKNAERLLLLEVKTGFYDLLLAESLLELAQKSLELNNQLLHITQVRLAAGDIAELDVNLARVEAARSEGRKIEAERELVPIRQRLLALMGVPALKDLKISSDSSANSPSAPALDQLKSLSLNIRPDLQALLAEKGKGDAEITLAQAEQIPNLTAGIAVSRETTLTSVGGMSDRSTDYLIGLKLSAPIPLFDRNQAALKSAQAKKSSAETRHSFARQNIEREVEAAHARLVASQKSVTIFAKEILPQLTENLKLVQEAYRLGETGILAVIEEQKKFFEVNDGYLTALNNWNTAVAKLEAAVGVDLKKEDGGNK